MSKTATKHPVDIGSWLELLNQLSIEEEQIRNRLRRIPDDLTALEKPLQLAERRVRRERLGGLQSASGDAIDDLERLEAEKVTLEQERDRLQDRLHALQGERSELVREALRPAWDQYCDAREHEIATATEIVEQVRPLADRIRAAINERAEAEQEVGRVLRHADRVCAGASLALRAGRMKAREPKGDQKPLDVCVRLLEALT